MYPLEELPLYYPILNEFDKGFIGYMLNKKPDAYFFIPTSNSDAFILVDRYNKNGAISTVNFAARSV